MATDTQHTEHTEHTPYTPYTQRTINSRGIPITGTVTLGAVVTNDTAERIREMADGYGWSVSQMLRYALAVTFTNELSQAQVQELTRVWTVEDKKEVLRLAAQKRSRSIEACKLRRQIEAARKRLAELEDMEN